MSSAFMSNCICFRAFWKVLETFLPSPKLRRISFSAMAVFLLSFTALSMDFNNQLRGPKVSEFSNHKRVHGMNLNSLIA